MSIYSDTLDKQKAYFRSGATLSYRFRKEMLLRLKNVLKENEERILSALSEDLGKSSFEGYATELLNACKAWAKSQGCTEFASDCAITNEASIRFHLNAGFTEANRIVCFTSKI